MISSTSNSQIKHITQLLKKSRLRDEEGVFVCEGIKMFDEVRKAASQTIIKAYFSESYFKDNSDKCGEIDYEVVDDHIFKELSETITPQGVMAVIRRPVYTQEQMLKGDTVRLLLLEDLRDPGNLGTILRTAEAAGMNGIILSRESVDMYNPKVIRSTMGAIFRVPFIYADDFKQTLLNVKAAGVRIYAAHLKGASDYRTLNYGTKAAVLIGNEANGLSDEVTMLADSCVKIPMAGSTESLNAAVAAALLMYELNR